LRTYVDGSSASSSLAELEELRRAVKQKQAELKKLELQNKQQERDMHRNQNPAAKRGRRRSAEDTDVEYSPPAKAAQRRPELKRQKKNSSAAVESLAQCQEDQPQLQKLTTAEKTDLQKKLDSLDDDRLDEVLAFLEPELGGPDEDEIQLDLEALTAERQQALIKLVDEQLKSMSAGEAASAPTPAFPVVEPGATPLAEPTPLGAGAGSCGGTGTTAPEAVAESMLGNTAEVLAMMSSSRP